MGWGGVDRGQGETPCCGGEVEAQVIRIGDDLGVPILGRGVGRGVRVGEESWG